VYVCVCVCVCVCACRASLYVPPPWLTHHQLDQRAFVILSQGV
jgi:hypothetical protein